MIYIGTQGIKLYRKLLIHKVINSETIMKLYILTSLLISAVILKQHNNKLVHRIKIVHTTETEAFSTIVKHGITETTLDKAISRLKMPPTETPSFWSKIANDPSYGDFHRRKAAIEIFKRHVHVGMPISKLKQILNHPTWLQRNDVKRVDSVIGWIPVTMNFEDSVFILAVLPREQWSAICLRVSGRIENQSFRNSIFDNSNSNTGNATIMEIGYF